jgi:hypothetical protein
MTLQTLNNTRQLAQQLRVDSGDQKNSCRRRGSLPTGSRKPPAKSPAPNARLGVTARATGATGGRVTSSFPAAGNELTGSTTTGDLARNSTLAARNDGGSESPGVPGV